MNETRSAILELSPADLVVWLKERNQPGYRADQVFEWIYRKRVGEFARMSNLPESLRNELEAGFRLFSLRKVRQTGSEDSTRKYLFSLADGNLIETVLIPASPDLYGSAADRKTLCVSTQVGCAYGCKFCASGLDGWTRNLGAGEIVEQIIQVEAETGEKVNNVVFMGMGEPLANFEHLLCAVKAINAEWGIGIGARHMTVSTSGLAPRIRELADQPLQIRLAISLHGATDEVRAQIMPVNRKYPLAVLMDACAYYCSRKKQKITFEFILIKGVNDDLEQARQLARLARRIGAKVNLIPYNQVSGLSWSRPSDHQQTAFLETLRSRGVDATIRREKGHDIDAACGQLRLQTVRDKTFAAVSEVR
jgi:23S rRNA (adenine2503-C2)-methyltransferase